MRQETSDATRHLCAGVYIDQKFRDTVIKEVYNDSYHRVAPSYGFDLVAVVEQARRAWALERFSQASLVLVLTTGLLTNAAAVVMTVCVVVVAQQIVFVLAAMPDLLRLKAKKASYKLLHRLMPYNEIERLNRKGRLALVRAAGCGVLALVPVVAAALLGTALSAAAAAATAILSLVVGLTLLTGASRQLLVQWMFRSESLRPGRLNTRLRVIDEQQSQPHVVYALPKPEKDKNDDPRLLPLTRTRRSTASPFVGSGESFHRWGAPLQVLQLKPRESNSERVFDRPPFTAGELLDWLRGRMTILATAEGTDQLPGLEIRDRVLVAENELAEEDLARLTADEQFADVIHRPHQTTQHYLELSVTETGEIVTTVFLRVTVIGRALTMDLVACALTPPPQEYKRAGDPSQSGLLAVLRAALRALRDLPRTLSRLWKLVDVPLIAGRALWARKDRSVNPHLRPVGTRMSVRQKKSRPVREIQVERVRNTIYDQTKIIEGWLLDEAETFLEQRGVDTSEFRTQATSIITTTITNSGEMTVNDAVIGNANTAAAGAMAAGMAQAAEPFMQVTASIAGNASQQNRPTGGKHA